MRKYEKYKVTVWSQSVDKEDKLEVFVPWSELEDFVGLMLTNYMVVKVDGGVLADEKEVY